MEVEHTNVGLKLYSVWVLANMAGLIVGLIPGLPLIVLGALMLTFPRGENESIQGIIIWTAGAAIAGALTGTAQWLVLRHHLTRRWILISAVGFVLGSPAVYIISVVLAHLPESVHLLLITGIDSNYVQGAIFGTVVGITQWSVLRKHVGRAGWWVLASTVGVGVGYGAGAVAARMIFDTSEISSSVLTIIAREAVAGAVAGAVGGIGYGAVTGMALLQSLQRTVSVQALMSPKP